MEDKEEGEQERDLLCPEARLGRPLQGRGGWRESDVQKIVDRCDVSDTKELSDKCEAGHTDMPTISRGMLVTVALHVVLTHIRAFGHFRYGRTPRARCYT
jgi:hypothetical protein